MSDTATENTENVTEETEEAQPLDVLTAFFVMVDPSGRVMVSTNSVPNVALQREASVADLEMYCGQVSREAGRLLLLQSLTPQEEPTVGERVGEALAKRAEDETSG